MWRNKADFCGRIAEKCFYGETPKNFSIFGWVPGRNPGRFNKKGASPKEVRLILLRCRTLNHRWMRSQRDLRCRTHINRSSKSLQDACLFLWLHDFAKMFASPVTRRTVYYILRTKAVKESSHRIYSGF